MNEVDQRLRKELSDSLNHVKVVHYYYDTKQNIIDIEICFMDGLLKGLYFSLNDIDLNRILDKE